MERQTIDYKRIVGNHDVKCLDMVGQTVKRLLAITLWSRCLDMDEHTEKLFWQLRCEVFT